MNTLVDVQENIAVLHSIVDGIPDHLIDLVCFKREASCGTICCGAGWAAMHPYFQDQGLEMNRTTPAVNGRMGSSFEDLDKLFGEKSFYKLFEKRTEGMWDLELLQRGMTDKQLLLARLKKGYYDYAPAHND